MDQDSIEVYGNVGTYAFDGNLLSFQLGEQLMNEGSTLVLPAYHNGMPVVHEHQWLGIQGYNVVMRGMNDDIKNVFKLTGFISIFDFE